MTEIDALHWHAEGVGNDLRERGFVALPMGVGPGVHDHRASRHDPDLGCLRESDAASGGGGGGAGGETAKLRSGREADPPVLSLLPPPFLLLSPLGVNPPLQPSVCRSPLIAP